MKKLLSLVLAVIMVISLLPMTMASAASEWSARTNEVDLRVGILGDSHIGNSDSVASPSNDGGCYYVKKAVEAHNALGANKLDGLVMTGDIVYQSTDNFTTHYDQLNIMLAEYGENFPIAFAMGNHEYQETIPSGENKATAYEESRQIFKDKMGLTPNHHTKMNGFDFFATAADGYDGTYSDATQAWLMSEVDKAIAATSTNANADGTFADGVIPNSTKPVFVALHHPVDGTINGNSYTGYNDTFEAWLRKRPQIINLTAHIHLATERPQSIFQDGFTAFHTPLTSIGKSSVGGTTDSPVYEHHGAMVEVKDNVVSLVRYNLVNKEYIGEPWTIDVGAIVRDMTDNDGTNDYNHQLYSADKRQNTPKPVWGTDAEITIRKRSNGALISFPNNASVAQTPNQQDGFIRAYRVEIKDANNNTIINESYANDYWNNPQLAAINRAFSGLGYGNSYTVNVYPRSPFLVEGDPISTTFTTREETVSAQSQRFEAEDYVASTGRAVTSSGYASGGKLFMCYQGTMVPGAPTNFNTSNGSAPSYSFDVTIPKDDTYTVEWAAGYRNNGNLSKITITATDKNGNVTTIGTNNTSSYVYEDLSMGELFPWKHIPMKKMRNSLQMTEGTYKINVDIGVCQTSLYLFAIDYIQFTPQTFDLPEGEIVASLIRDENGVRKGVSISSGSDTAEGDITSAGTYADMTNGKYESGTGQWHSKFEQTNAYFQIDLGKAKHISEIIYRPFNNVASGGAYWRQAFEIQASNYADFRDYEVLGTQTAAIPIETNFVLSTDPTITKYRYVRVQNNAGIKNSVIGCREIDISGYEGEDTVIGADLVESVSIADGATLTNVKNAKSPNPWNFPTPKYQGGKPIEIQFAEDTDMSLVNTSTVKLSIYDTANSTLVAQTYTPIIDAKNKILKIDLCDLEGFVGLHSSNSNAQNKMQYRLEITDAIMSEDGMFKANPKTVTFKTNEIAKAPYVEGKELKNVALYKSARYKSVPAWGFNSTTEATANKNGIIGKFTPQYTNGSKMGDATDNDKTTGNKIVDATIYYRRLHKDIPVLIDLGARYKVVGLAFGSTQSNHHYDDVNHYLTNTETWDETGLTSVWNSGDVSKLYSATTKGYAASVPVTSNEATRYVLVDATSTQYPSEIMVYAYVDAEADNDMYFTSPVSAYVAETEETPYAETVTITANAEDAALSVLLLAEFEGGKLTQTVQSVAGASGKVTLSMPKAANKTYKAFLWNSLKGIIPVTEDICY